MNIRIVSYYHFVSHAEFSLKIIEHNETMTKSGLKGHHNLAQGKATRGSVALGLSRATEIDREPALIKKNSVIAVEMATTFISYVLTPFNCPPVGVGKSLSTKCREF